MTDATEPTLDHIMELVVGYANTEVSVAEAGNPTSSRIWRGKSDIAFQAVKQAILNLLRGDTREGGPCETCGGVGLKVDAVRWQTIGDRTITEKVFGSEPCPDCAPAKAPSTPHAPLGISGEQAAEGITPGVVGLTDAEREACKFAAISLRGDMAYMARIMGGDYESAYPYKVLVEHAATLRALANRGRP